MVHVREREAVVLHGSVDRLLELPDHGSEKTIAFHPDGVQSPAAADRRRSRPASRDFDEVMLGPIGLKMTRQNSPVAIGCSKKNRARVYAEIGSTFAIRMGTCSG